MPAYRYHARDAEGRSVDGSHEAADPRTAREELQHFGYTLVSLEEELPPEPEEALGGWDFGVSRKALARFTRQLANLQGAGVPLVRCLQSTSRRSAGPSLRRALAQVSQQVQEGRRFSEALASTSVFDPLYVAMVRVGEASGELGPALERLATLLERDVAARRKVGLALAYPGIVLSVALVLTWGMATFMMPIFEPIFRDGGLNLERDFPVTWLLLQLGHLGGSPLFVGLVVLLALAGGFALRAARGVPALERVWLYVPVFGRLTAYVLTARLARGLAALTHGGVPLVAALTQAGEATGSPVYAAAAATMARGVGEGRRLSRLLGESRLFDPVMVDMVDVGEQAGTLAEMLDRAADYFEAESDASRDLLTALLEPFTMLLVGAIVSVFVVALMVPLMSVGH